MATKIHIPTPLRPFTDKLDAVLRSLSESGVRSLTSTPPTLEDLFLRHYQADANVTGSMSEVAK